MDARIPDEVNGCDLGDRRLDQRLGRLLGDLSERIGKGIPLASQDCTKAVYRFLDNAKVAERLPCAGLVDFSQGRRYEPLNFAAAIYRGFCRTAATKSFTGQSSSTESFLQ